MSIKIQPKASKPLEVEYGDGTYILPGRIPVEIATARAEVTRPKIMAGSQKDEYDAAVGIASMNAFYANVVPADFKAVLDLDDIGQVFDAWAEHVKLGKSKSSDA